MSLMGSFVSSLSSFLLSDVIGTFMKKIRNIDRVQATILQDDEEKVVVEESFKAETFTGKEPLEEPNMNSSSSSAFESWIIKLEQGVNVFLTVRFL